MSAFDHLQTFRPDRQTAPANGSLWPKADAQCDVWQYANRTLIRQRRPVIDRREWATSSDLRETPLDHDHIREVGIDDEGRLYIIPTSRSFPYIWRAALEVNWDEKRGCLFGPRPRKWTYFDWFQHIVFAAKDEYEVSLTLRPDTLWVNVPEDVQEAIRTN